MTDPIRARLNGPNMLHEDMYQWRDALRAVLDLCDEPDPEMTFPEYQANIRRVIAEHLGVTDGPDLDREDNLRRLREIDGV